MLVSEPLTLGVADTAVGAEARVIALLVKLETNCGSERRARLRKERRLRRAFASRGDRSALPA